MHLYDSDNSSPLSTYLKALDTEDLLTREEELELAVQIEELQMDILLVGITSKLFRMELHSLLSTLITKENGIQKISRALTLESTKREIDTITEDFVFLLDCLEDGNVKKGLECLYRIKLSGTLIHGLLNRIKKKLARVRELQSKMRDLQDFFGIQDPEQIREIITKLKKQDSEIIDFWKDQLEVSDTELNSKVHEYHLYKNSKKSLSDLGLKDESDWVEIGNLYDGIFVIEEKIRPFQEELVRRNLRLVVSRARHFTNRGLPFEDMVQEGNLGLMRAVWKYDSSRGTRLTTMATPWVDQAIRRAISNKAKTVRIPTHIEFKQSKIAAAKIQLTHELGREPEIEEIAELIEVDPEELRQLASTMTHQVSSTPSRDREDKDSETGFQIESIPDEDAPDAFEVVAQNLLKGKIRKILSKLSPRSEKIIRLRYGIGEPRGRKLTEVAEIMGVSKQAIHITEIEAIKELREMSDDLDSELI